jgi:hypothetical protein
VSLIEERRENEAALTSLSFRWLTMGKAQGRMSGHRDLAYTQGWMWKELESFEQEIVKGGE